MINGQGCIIRLDTQDCPAMKVMTIFLEMVTLNPRDITAYFDLNVTRLHCNKDDIKLH